MAILAKDRTVDRQYPLYAVQAFNLSELEDGVAVPVIKLPAGARVISGHIVTDIALDSTSTDTMDLGDSADADRYTTSPVSIHAVGSSALTITGYKYTEATFLNMTWVSGGGTPTVGSGVVIVGYVVDGRGNEVEPSLT
jgi:hypothetical protein